MEMSFKVLTLRCLFVAIANEHDDRACYTDDETRRADQGGEKKDRDGKSLQQELERACGFRTVGDRRDQIVKDGKENKTKR
jgi:hypothetical protein